MAKHHVVIIGGGFGGLHAAKELQHPDIEVTLLDRRNFHLFQPLLYQVATGGLSPGEIASPLRAIFEQQKNLRILMTEVTGFDPAAKQVLTEMGPIAYDTLILAAGATSSYFGNDQWAAIAPPLKSLEDATAIRARMLTAFEEAEKESDPEKRRAWLTFLIVGGGPTGVELAGALGEIANDTLRNGFRSASMEEARILILDSGPRILSTFSEKLSKAATESLIRLNVRCRGGIRVIDVTPEGARIRTVNGEDFIPSRTIVWAAGVGASPLAARLGEALDLKPEKSGRLAVEADCSLPGHPEIFAIGDIASFSHGLERPLPGVAQVAMQMGTYVGKQVRQRLNGQPGSKTQQGPPFSYWDKGNMAVIGRQHAVAQIGKLELSGVIAWLAWVFIHLMYLVGFQSRVIVALRWGFDYFSFNRGARIITYAGQRPPAPAAIRSGPPAPTP
jgi:NADH:ubiquinone reductase (H+-translocating)